MIPMPSKEGLAMIFKMTVDMSNAAFEEQAELVAILEKVIADYKACNTGKAIIDSNGNKVGQWVLAE